MWKLITKVWDILFAWKKVSGTGKNPMYSKTIRVLAVTWLGLLMNSQWGITLSAEEQTGIVVFVGFVMRLISHSPVGFYEINDDTENKEEPSA
jgi:hypothetical protein